MDRCRVDGSAVPDQHCLVVNVVAVSLEELKSSICRGRPCGICKQLYQYR